MKIGFISDLHFKVNKKSNKFLPHVVKSIERFEDLCDERKVDMVMIGGDTFCLKQVVAIEAQNQALFSLRKIMKKYETFMITGNHDTFTHKDNTINGVNIFMSDCNLFIDYGKVEIGDCLFHFLPYFPDEIYKEKLSEIKTDTKKKNILLTHVSLSGFNVENGHEDVWSELSANDFGNRFYRIFSGHYHSFQTKKRITYISSPFESHFNDPGPHGFVFYDTDTDEIEFVENDLSPRFIEMELNAKNLETLSTAENSFIKLKINKHIDSGILLKYKSKLLARNFDVTFDFNVVNTAQKIAVAKDWSDYIHESPDDLVRSYVDTLDVKNKKELLDYLLHE